MGSVTIVAIERRPDARRTGPLLSQRAPHVCGVEQTSAENGLHDVSVARGATDPPSLRRRSWNAAAATPKQTAVPRRYLVGHMPSNPTPRDDVRSQPGGTVLR